MNIKKFEAVLFDMDGVIVDSMPYHFISWFEALKKYKVTVTPLDIYEKEGEKSDSCVRRFFQRDGIKFDEKKVQDVLNLRNKIYKKYFKVFLFEDIEPVLKNLKKQNIKTAIVTGSSKQKVMAMLPKKIIKMFDVIISADMVKRGKPHPDSYLTAAKELNLNPGQCLVIENAPNGIKAAKAAKMFCVAVTTSLPKQYLSRADLIVSRIGKVLLL